MKPIPHDTDMDAQQIVDAAFRVHRALGPGLLENIYEVCLVHELRKRDLHVVQQVSLPIVYDNVELETGLRLDVLVNESVIVELKAVERILPVHHAQVLTYLKLTGHRLGLLINFNVPLIKEGISRIAL